MTLYRRNMLFQAFRLPLIGRPAEDVPPQWLISRLQSGELEMNRMGGLTVVTPWGVQACTAGDVVILTEDDEIEFMKPEEFAKYEPLPELIAA